jgi:predicted naringenin-chalcone synthase
MSFIAGAHAVVGPYGYSQNEITEAFAAVMSPQGAEREVIDRIHGPTGV